MSPRPRSSARRCRRCRVPSSQVQCTTLQAVSGSGFPGLSVAEMYDNCVPYIGQEEDKMEEETGKILGQYNGNGSIDMAPIKVGTNVF